MDSDTPQPEQAGESLWQAVHANDADLVLDLIVAGECQDLRGEAHEALVAACSLGCYEIVGLLLEAGVEVDVRMSYDFGITPLGAAAEGGHFAIVRLLIAHGACPVIFTGMPGLKPEALARRAGHAETAAFLRSCEDEWYRKNAQPGQ